MEPQPDHYYEKKKYAIIKDLQGKTKTLQLILFYLTLIKQY